MNDLPTMVEIMAGFARRLGSDYVIDDVLHDVVDDATMVLGLAGGGVSLVHEGRLAFATASPERITAIEHLQEDTQSGPCVEAYRSRRPVLVTDLSVEHRWPALTAAAAREGIGAVMGVPMYVNETGIGVLNLYADEARDWTDEELHTATTFADMASAYVANAHRLDEARATAEQLQRALDTRVVIEQAKGMLARERGMSVDDAFELLRAHPRTHRVPLRSVAEGVVNLRLRI